MKPGHRKASCMDLELKSLFNRILSRGLHDGMHTACLRNVVKIACKFVD
jgi:hypothetical protein